MIENIEKFNNNPYLFIQYKKYDYKFGEVDLISSASIFGNSQLMFGLFYNEVKTVNKTSLKLTDYMYIRPELRSNKTRFATAHNPNINTVNVVSPVTFFDTAIFDISLFE